MTKAVATRHQPKRVPTLNAGRALGPKSPLTEADIDIQSFLALCISNWSSFYNEDEKQQILSSLPPSIQIQANPDERDSANGVVLSRDDKSEAKEDGIACPITSDFISTDAFMKRAIARFKRDIGEGYYEKSWQDKAKKAMEERKRGNFDQYLANLVDEMFSFEENATEGRGENESDFDDREYGSGRSKAMKGKQVTKRLGQDKRAKRHGEILLRDELALSDQSE